MAKQTQGEAAALLSFHGGTLHLDPSHAITAKELPPDFTWDERLGVYRALASAYAGSVLHLRDLSVPLDDRTRQYGELTLATTRLPAPRHYQEEAVQAWSKNQGRGVVVLPTGSGKSLVALLALCAVKRDTLIVAPTLDLVRQWAAHVRRAFDLEPGVLGGGEHRPGPITVSTYDSAHLHMDRLGNRFGLVIFDEVHHLPSDAYALAAEACIAPFRLGLTATLERADGTHARLNGLIGPTVYRRDIVDFSGRYLANYTTERIEVELTDPEREAYETARATYLNFVRSQRIHMGGANGWQHFLQRAAITDHGRAALEGFFEHRRIAQGASRKLTHIEALLNEHRHHRVILFTTDNGTAYQISQRFLVPIITHKTKVTERAHILEGFRDGTYGAVVTSRVLNEGVDVPEANVAIVVSGSGSIREHVQRLGRILRPAQGKQAKLYELVTARTSETRTSERRRDHAAYRQPA